MAVGLPIADAGSRCSADLMIGIKIRRPGDRDWDRWGSDRDSDPIAIAIGIGIADRDMEKKKAIERRDTDTDSDIEL